MENFEKNYRQIRRKQEGGLGYIETDHGSFQIGKEFYNQKTPEEISGEIEELIKSDITGKMKEIQERYGEEYGNPDFIVLNEMKAWKEIERWFDDSEYKKEFDEVVEDYYNSLIPPTRILNEFIGFKTVNEFLESYKKWKEISEINKEKDI